MVSVESHCPFLSYITSSQSPLRANQTNHKQKFLVFFVDFHVEALHVNVNPRNNPKITGRVFYEPIMSHARLAGRDKPFADCTDAFHWYLLVKERGALPTARFPILATSNRQRPCISIKPMGI